MLLETFAGRSCGGCRERGAAMLTAGLLAVRKSFDSTDSRMRTCGAALAEIDIARRLAEAIWHMLTRNRPFAPAGATSALAA